MRFVPKSRDEWVAFALLPFKVLVVAVPMWQMAANIGIPDRLTHQYFGGHFLTSGLALLCLPALLLGALVQAAFCSRGQVWWTLGFLGFGFLFGPTGRTGFSPEISRHISLALVAIAMAFVVAAYLKLRRRELLALAAGHGLSVVVRLAYEAVGPAEAGYNLRRVVYEIGPLLSLIAQASITVGFVLLPRRVTAASLPSHPARSETPQ